MNNMKIDLTQRVAIVTGGGRGIGREISLGLADAGASVVVCSRTQAELEAVAKEIDQMGGKALPLVTDLTSSQQLEILVDTTVKKFGRIDILVNNAARSYMRSLLELREDGWDKIFDTNVKAVWLLSRLVAQKMIEQKYGKIINITTVGAEKADFNMGAYSCSKAALKMLTRCCAREWAQYGITVNAVGPGLTRTDFSKPLWSNPDMVKQVARSIPKGRMAEPEEMVGSVLFLASEGADYITGHTIYVDGGALTA